MLSNQGRYRKDLDSLIHRGQTLYLAIQAECFPEECEKQLKNTLGEKAKGVLNGLPKFKEAYQPWYSEAKAMIRQLLPDRLSDFASYYEKPKARKDITHTDIEI